jgi:hypothetical protein
MKAVRWWGVLAALCVAPSAWAVNWEDEGVIKGVHVWSAEEPGSGVMSFKGEIVAPVHIQKLVAVFADSSQRKHWVDRFADFRTIEKPSALSEIYWIKFKLPAMISNRDYVLRADGEVDAGNHVFTAKIKSVPDKRKGEDDCCVRATVNRTFYRFTALKAVNGQPRTKLEVEVNTDPKGLLPNWLVNLIQKEWPSKTLNGLLRHTAAAAGKPTPETADVVAQLAAWHD